MMRLPLAPVFVAAFAMSSLGTVPLSMVLGLFHAENAGLSARASGSIWSGHLQDLRLSGVHVGDAEARLDPFALLTGVRRLQIRSERGVGLVVGGRTIGVEHVRASVDFAELGLALPFEGVLRLDDATLLFQDGRCSRAEGRISTDVFRRNVNGPDLAGTLACDGSAAVARLLGRVSDMEIAMVLRVEAGGSYRLDSRATGVSSAIRGALLLAGFAQSGESFVRLDKGMLGT